MIILLCIKSADDLELIKTFTLDSVIKNIKVLVITPTLECGGAERFVSLLCNNFSSENIQLYLAVINNSRPFYKITNSAVPVYDLGIKRVSASFFKLKRLTRKIRPDIIFTTANHLNLFSIMLKPLFSRKILWLARESSVVSINSTYARNPVIYNFLLKKIYKRFNHIVCQSAYMQHDLVLNYGVDINKTSIIYNAVDPELQYTDGPVKNNSFITVARLSPEKGISNLLRTVASLKLPFQYTIAGSGAEKETLEKLTKDLAIDGSVHFVAEQQHPFKGNENSHLYLMGSLYEGFPNAVLEANALGIPVVARRVPGGINDIIIDGENGFLCDNDEELRKNILVALSYPFNRKKISEKTVSRFSIEKMLGSMADLFSGLKKK